jgi:hydroxymethylbilane synthase
LSAAPLRIGTRGSLLALIQARAVAEALDVPTDIVTITTAGDVARALGDKSRWVSTLEDALLAGDIDLAVHSAKDVPGQLADGTEIAAVPRRADPLDLLVGERRLEDVREGARVGTSSLRRRAQMLAARPDVTVVEIRGNVDTRMRKRAAGEADVLVLAAAGLDRLNRRDEAGGHLDGELFVPAAGQGALAVQARAGSDAAAAVAAITHAHSAAYLEAERAVVAELDASCHTPVGVFADAAGDHLRVRAFAGLPDGSEWLIDEVTLPAADPAAAGRELAARMLAAGAADLLRAAEAMAP